MRATDAPRMEIACPENRLARRLLGALNDDMAIRDQQLMSFGQAYG